MKPDRIGKYQILDKIGQGAMGEVYRAHDTILGRDVAIKTMSAAIGQDEDLRKRFHREAQSAARLNHPNIVTLYDFGEDEGKIFMAMELLAGGDLKDLLRRGPLGLEEKLALMEQICDGLAAAHAASVVHRDLKPANIHVLPDGKVKIVDFGLARLGSSDMTKTGMVMGTPNYMSPEQVRGTRVDARSDVFSLGAVFYELLSNRKAFDADSLHTVLFQVLEYEPPPVRHWVPELPDVFVPFLEKALAKDPARRFQNAGEMREALRQVRQGMVGGIQEDADLLSLLETGAATDGVPAGPGPGWTHGSAALDPARPGSAAASTPPVPTLSGASTTHSGTSLAGAGGQRLLLYAGGGLVTVGVVFLALFLWQRNKPSPPPEGGGAGVELVTRQLVTTKLQLAQAKLEVKDFAGAATEAKQVLELDAGNAEAKAILGQVETTFKELESAATEAREAVKAGDSDRASRAVARAMAIDPQHPVADELSPQINSRFQGQAEEARQGMKRASVAAEQAKATSQQPFAEAVALGREAEVLYQRGEFTGAAQKFLDARNKFERARRAAQERVVALPAPSLIPAPRRAPPGAAASPMAGVPTAAPTPALVVPTPAPPSATAAPTLAPAVADETAVRQVIMDYERAIEQRDLALYRTIKPNLSGGEERRLRIAFQHVQDHDVRITIESLRVVGNEATVRLSRHDTVKGKPLVPSQQTVVLVKRADTWTIREIGQ